MAMKIIIYGATGHTGRFVVRELVKCGRRPVLAGRNEGKLAELKREYPDLDVRVADLGDADGLSEALDGGRLLINCAGPFAETAPALIDAALRAKVDYVDVAAEVEANLDTFAHYLDRAREAGIRIVPAVAFFGGLADFLATAITEDWPKIDELTVAYGLDSWKPTDGTLAAGRTSRHRRNGRRIVFDNGQHHYRDGTAPTSEWSFPAPFGSQPVVGQFTAADTVLIPRHLRLGTYHGYMSTTALKDLADPNAAPPEPVDESGRSGQQFMVDVIARCGGKVRRATASGQDIYAITAPIIAAAVDQWEEASHVAPGVYAPADIFDATQLLNSLSPRHLTLEFITNGDSHADAA